MSETFSIEIFNLWGRVKGTEGWSDRGPMSLLAHDILEHMPTDRGTALQEFRAIATWVITRPRFDRLVDFQWWQFMGRLYAENQDGLPDIERRVSPEVRAFFDASMTNQYDSKPAFCGWCQVAGFQPWDPRRYYAWLENNGERLAMHMQRGVDLLRDRRRRTGVTINHAKLTGILEARVHSDGEYTVHLHGDTAEVQFLVLKT